MLGHIIQTRVDPLSMGLFELVVGFRVVEWTEPLLQLGRYKVQPFGKTTPFRRSDARRKTRVGVLISDVLDDERAFGQDLAIIEFERWNVPLRINR